MFPVQKNKKIIFLLFILHFSSLIASMRTDELYYFFYTKNIIDKKEQMISDLTHSQNEEESMALLDLLSRVDPSFIAAFHDKALKQANAFYKTHLFCLLKNKNEAERYFNEYVKNYENELCILLESRTVYNYKSIALIDLKLNMRVLLSEYALFLIQENFKDEGFFYLKKSIGKKTHDEVVAIHTRLKKMLKPPKMGRVGWTLEGFTSLENAKEFYIFDNYLKESHDIYSNN